MAESVKVIVRCRPMNARETGLNCKTVIKMVGSIAQCSITNPAEKNVPPKMFTFDGAYGEDSTTEQIYTDIGYPLVEGVTEGYNGTVFAYGQTGSGKSFSMQGLTQPDSQRGIIPRAFEHIFETIQVTDGSKFLVHASYVEIYNEEVRDLLGNDIKRKLDLKEHPERGVYVQDLSKHVCKNVTDCGKVMEKGWKNRSTGATLMNADSSRSHSIFTIHLERCETDKKGEDRIRGAKLNLVDLAGSERQSKTGATGDRLKEATKINLSLSALGNVISALVDAKSTHIPYRDSKLTRLLQDSLGGNTKTLMVACLSPADNNYDETLSTLRYANRAKNIKNKPKINEDPKDAMIREFQEEIKKLKAMLMGEIPVQLGGDNSDNNRINKKKEEKQIEIDIEAERENIRREYELELKKVRDELRIMKLSKEEIESEMGKLKDEYDNRLKTLEKTRQQKNNKNLKKTGTKSQLIENNKKDDTALDESKGGDTGVKKNVQNKTVVKNKINQNKTETQNSITTDSDSSSLNQESLNHKDEGKPDHKELPDTNKTPTNSDTSSIDSTKDKGKTQPTKDLKQDGGDSVKEENNKVLEDNRKIPDDSAALAEAQKRLKELEQKFQVVGGEQSGNKALVEKHQKKLTYAQERYKRLKEAMNLGGDDILVNIYENINDELKATRKKYVREQDRSSALESEIKDLQTEFESDKRDYLSTIREQERELKYLQAVIDRLEPTIRRDCNYSSLMKVRSMAVWDDDRKEWKLPAMILQKTKLPPAAPMDVCTFNMHNEGESYPCKTVTYSGGRLLDDADEFDAEDHLQQKINSSEYDGAATFRNNRAQQLLQNAQSVRGMNRNGLGGSHSASAGMLYGRPQEDSPTSMWSNGGSQSGAEADPSLPAMRPPVRLQSLDPISTSKPRKLNKRLN